MAKKGKVKSFKKSETEERPKRFRKYQYLFLIVCEDENTEKRYFEHFKEQIPEDSIYLEAIGTGRDPKGVVERAIEEKVRLATNAGKDVDITWVVFDKDDADLNEKRIQRFKEAFEMAGQEKNMKLAPSNEVFEVWLLLHLIGLSADTAIPRRDIYRMLEDSIKALPGYGGFQYEHGNASVLTPINERGDQAAAIRRAKLLEVAHNGKTFLESNPCTRVYLLVEDLLAWIRYFAYEP
ncbi:RloB family protein [Chitinophaga sancti]|uniref:RloB family protein n=1 Tax=Chitinophaga sancti TaxID=1004 RepID=A0A1K1S2N7_9BACT|nr:RloB family protein [Chitinophaga sancti]WQD59653.1 RloB family protein [Chitinophaga sancti]WQG88216.1 RloB family protein [Chitinophaga sancti]SFW78450.1 RloB-like protein [Chitinophaga sancti]